MPGRGTRKNFDRGAHVIFWGLKFDKLLCFGLHKVRVVFGLTRNLHFWGVAEQINYRINS